MTTTTDTIRCTKCDTLNDLTMDDGHHSTKCGYCAADLHRQPLQVGDNRHLNNCAEADLQCTCGNWVALPLPNCPSFCVPCGTLWVEA